MRDICNTITEIVTKYVQLKCDDDSILEQSLTEMGMESLIFVRIMVDIEERFGIEIPDELLLRSGLDSIEGIAEVVFSIVRGRE